MPNLEVNSDDIWSTEKDANTGNRKKEVEPDPEREIKRLEMANELTTMTD